MQALQNRNSECTDLRDLIVDLRENPMRSIIAVALILGCTVLVPINKPANAQQDSRPKGYWFCRCFNTYNDDPKSPAHELTGHKKYLTGIFQGVIDKQAGDEWAAQFRDNVIQQYGEDVSHQGNWCVVHAYSQDAQREWNTEANDTSHSVTQTGWVGQ